MTTRMTGDIFLNGQATGIPSSITRQISDRAAKIIQQTAPVGMNNSRARVQGTREVGQIGVYFPPEAMHLLYLDQGIKPRVMVELKGKTIPIRTSDGSIIFRKAKNVGMNILSRDENGNLTKYKIAWSHPGVAPMNFVQDALKQAFDEWTNNIDDNDVVELFNSMGPEAAKFIGRLTGGS